MVMNSWQRNTHRSHALLHTDLRERTLYFVAGAECEGVVCCVGQVVQNAERHGAFRDVPVPCYTRSQILFLTCKLPTDKAIESD